MDLKEIRNEIDYIDKQLLELFCKRMDCVLKVARYKADNGMPILRPEREQEILDRVKKEAPEGYKEDAAELFVSLMEISRKRQAHFMETGREM